MVNYQVGQIIRLADDFIYYENDYEASPKIIPRGAMGTVTGVATSSDVTEAVKTRLGFPVTAVIDVINFRLFNYDFSGVLLEYNEEDQIDRFVTLSKPAHYYLDIVTDNMDAVDAE